MAGEKSSSEQPASNSGSRSSGTGERSRISSANSGRAMEQSRPRPAENGAPSNGHRPANGQAWGRQPAPASSESGQAPEGSSGPNTSPMPYGRQYRRPRPERNGNFPACNDLDELRDHIGCAAAGTGQVAGILKHSNFRPREPAFTKLIQACVNGHDWQKAMELWEVMLETPNLKPNTFTYSVLIHVCAVTGRWEEAEDLFKRQLKEAESDPACQPNHITYSSLLTACCRGKKLDKALEWYEHLTKAGVEADGLTFSGLIIGCFDNGIPIERILDLVEDMHQAGQLGQQEVYIRLFGALGKKGVYGAVVEVLMCALMAGAEPTLSICLAFLQACEACRTANPALDLLHAWEEAFGAAPAGLSSAVLRVLLSLNAQQHAMKVWNNKLKAGRALDPELARLLLDAVEASGNTEELAMLNKDFQVMGIKPRPKGP